MTTLVLAFALAGLLAAGLVPPVRWLALRLGVVDRPNARSSHQEPTPRAGGLAIVVALAATIPWFLPVGPGAIGIGLLVGAVAAVSLADDVRSLSFLPRLAVQAMAAGAVVVALDLPIWGLDLPGITVELPGGIGTALAVLFIVAYANFFNFMDGINGLAAGQALVSGGALAIWLRLTDCVASAVVAAAVAGASGGFLPYNFPRARVFMGDVGSVTLGFLLAVLSLEAHARGGIPWTAMLLVHGAFLFDAGFTILKRALRGEPIVRPHREHSYQLLVRAGWSHSATTPVVLSASLVCCASSFLYVRPEGWARLLALIGPGAVLAAYATTAHTRPRAATIAPEPGA